MIEQIDNLDGVSPLAVRAAIDRLKLEGYSKAYICERSHETEDDILAKLEAERRLKVARALGQSGPPQP